MKLTKAQKEFLKKLHKAEGGRRTAHDMRYPAYPMPLALERAGLIKALPNGALKYPTSFQITDDGRVVLHGGIPCGVYWSREAGNFYSVDTNRGMGQFFYEAWQDCKDRFPEKATTSPRIDLHYDKAVKPAATCG